MATAQQTLADSIEAYLHVYVDLSIARLIGTSFIPNLALFYSRLRETRDALMEIDNQIVYLSRKTTFRRLKKLGLFSIGADWPLSSTTPAKPLSMDSQHRRWIARPPRKNSDEERDYWGRRDNRIREEEGYTPPGSPIHAPLVGTLNRVAPAVRAQDAVAPPTPPSHLPASLPQYDGPGDAYFEDICPDARREAAATYPTIDASSITPRS